VSCKSWRIQKVAIPEARGTASSVFALAPARGCGPARA
jgi:hypothetical protein